MTTKTITEASATITISDEKKLSRKTEVFYNPVMKINRDLSVAVLNAWGKNELQIADSFAASGVRSIRFLKELTKEKIKNIAMNDYSEKAIESIKENLKQNNLDKDKRIIIQEKDANMFLLESNGFDYIDLDPFGSPVAFLDSACKRIARDGMLAVTATDTSALCGSFPDACRRKYAAIPFRCPIMHELGLRILIKKCQEIGAQYDKALTPIFSYAKDHYMRVFFMCKKGKLKANEIVDQHKIIMIDNNPVGSLWTGQLWDKDFAGKMNIDEQESKKFLAIIEKEAGIPSVGFYDIHAVCKKNHLEIPKYEPLLAAIEKAGYAVARTHFSLNGIRTLMGESELIEMMKEIMKK